MYIYKYISIYIYIYIYIYNMHMYMYIYVHCSSFCVMISRHRDASTAPNTNAFLEMCTGDASLNQIFPTAKPNRSIPFDI